MLEILRKRRSIRRYQNQPLEPKQIKQLVQAALMSPSSRGIRPWEFIFVTDREILLKLAQSKTESSNFLKDAALGIVVAADGEKSDVWIEDTSIASVVIHLTAVSLGLGSCWIQIRNRHHDAQQTSEEYIREVLGLPANYHVESIMAVGMPAEVKPPFEEKNLLYSKVHAERYGEVWRSNT